MHIVHKLGVLATVCVLFASVATAGTTSTFLKNSTTSATISLNGKWHRKHFSEAKSFAEKNGVPLIAVWSNGDACSHCTKFEKACNSSVFKNWMATSGCVFYFTYPGDGKEGKLGDENSVFKWIRQSQSAFPFIRIYWKVKGKVKVDVSTVGDDVDNKQDGSAGGKAAMNYFKKVLKAYKYTPVPAVPKYTGGAFEVGDTDGDHLEAEVGVTEWVDVSVVRTNASAVAVASTNTLQVVYPDGLGISNLTERIDWAKGDSSTTIRVDLTGVTTNISPVTLVLLDAAGKAVATNHIRLVDSVENSPSNPLWIGEKTSEELEWGEWTMDLDAAAAKVQAYNEGTGNSASGSGKPLLGAAPSVDRAYTLVLLEGALWCPDCKNTDAYLFENEKFKTWAQENKVALVAIDLPTGDDTSTAPTLLTSDTYTADKSKSYYGVSGASYVSRKMLDAEKAAETLERNFEIAQLLRLPNWTNATRPPVPSIFIMRDDGTIAARNQYFGGVASPTSAADIDAHIERLNEMLAQADMPEEETNDNAYRTTESIGIRETVGTNDVKTISFTDSADVYRLDPETTFGKRMTFVAEGSSDAAVQLKLIRVDSASSSVVEASATGKLSEGVVLGATVPTTNCYISVGYETTNSVPVDGSFSVASKSPTVFQYELSTDFVVEPTELARDNTVTISDGNLKLSVALVSNQLYRITGLAATPENGEYLTPVVGGTTDCLYTSVFEGDAPLSLSESTVSIQKWNPGTVGFVVQRASVAESAGSYNIRVARSDGTSGRATATVSFKSAKYDGLIGAFEPVELVWEEGDDEIKVVDVSIVDNTFADSDQVVVFSAETAGDAEQGLVEFNLTIRDNDKAIPGKAAIVSTVPAMAKRNTVFARRGGDVAMSLERILGATGPLEVELSATAGTLDAAEFAWSNRVSDVQTATLTLPGSGSAVTVVLTPKKGSAVDSYRRKLVVNLLDADAPGFEVDSLSVSATRYIPIAAASVALDEKEATTVKKYSGDLPAGVSWNYDAENRRIVFAGVPKKGGSFTAVFRAYNGSKAGLTTAVTFNVTDPMVEGSGEDSTQPLNAAVAKTITLSDLVVLKTGMKSAAGAMTVTIPRSGRASAKFRSVEYGVVTFSCASWDAIDPADGTLTATLEGKAGEETLTLGVSVSADGKVELALAGYEFVMPETAWSKANPATDFKGYYTGAMPYGGTLGGDAPARGTGGITLKMTTDSAINSGKVVFSGFYPSGKAFSGSATLAARNISEDGSFWGDAVLPVVVLGSGDTLAAALDFSPGAYDKTATNMVDTSTGTCAGRCYYKTIRRAVRTADGTHALWRHVDKASAVSGDVALDVKGTYYDSTENFVSCCQSSHGTPNLTFFVMDGVNDSAAVEDFGLGEVDLSLFATNKSAIAVTYAKATSSAKTKTSQIKKTSAATALSSFTFTLSTGLVTGSFKVDGVTFTYKGVVMPGWGSQDCTSCGYSVEVDGGSEAQFHPFISGSAWFNDTIEYEDARGKTRTATVRRSTPFSVGVKKGE